MTPSPHGLDARALPVIVALLAVLAATTSACTSGGHVDTADLNTVAAKTRGYVKQFTDDAGAPAMRPFTEMTNFCGDDGNDESRTEYVNGGSLEPADSSTIEATAKRYTTDGWKREDLSGDIDLRRDGYVIIVGRPRPRSPVSSTYTSTLGTDEI